MIKGKIIKGIGGFYYVDTGNDVYECKARGNFRNQKITPLVGDNVEISVNDNSENTIDTILQRKNELVRPPLANIDQLFIVASLVDPKINTTIIDNLIAIAEYKNITPVVIITKTDLQDNVELYQNIYEKAGYSVILCNNSENSPAYAEIHTMMVGKCSAFTGNTGVGKSTLLNRLFPDLNLKTGETSKKLGRGKHTTRHCELFKVDNGYIADTPGFSSLEFARCERILKEDLPYCFKEFAKYLGCCKFSTCSHTNDKGCAIVEAVNNNEISKSRHESYISMYNEVKNIKEWEL